MHAIAPACFLAPAAVFTQGSVALPLQDSHHHATFTPPAGAGHHGLQGVYSHRAEPPLRFLSGCWQALQRGYATEWRLPQHVPAPGIVEQPEWYGCSGREDSRLRFVVAFDVLLRVSTSIRLAALLQEMGPKGRPLWARHGGEVLACLAVVGPELHR
jgi:hypothetical protein